MNQKKTTKDTEKTHTIKEFSIKFVAVLLTLVYVNVATLAGAKFALFAALSELNRHADEKTNTITMNGVDFFNFSYANSFVTAIVVALLLMTPRFYRLMKVVVSFIYENGTSIVQSVIDKFSRNRKRKINPQRDEHSAERDTRRSKERKKGRKRQ